MIGVIHLDFRHPRRCEGNDRPRRAEVLVQLEGVGVRQRVAGDAQPRDHQSHGGREAEDRERVGAPEESRDVHRG